jgi:heterodisulfide reductase subunit A
MFPGMWGISSPRWNPRAWVREIKHGASVIAIGADVYTPTEYLYGEDEKVLTHVELGELIAKGDEKVINALKAW